jgi:hypothetical protein
MDKKCRRSRRPRPIKKIKLQMNKSLPRGVMIALQQRGIRHLHIHICRRCSIPTDLPNRLNRHSEEHSACARRLFCSQLNELYHRSQLLCPFRRARVQDQYDNPYQTNHCRHSGLYQLITLRVIRQLSPELK